tara:strand:+ start:859 stop:984 length:126 start_codon:yes stop_codon:yes gene_type:complete
MFGSKETTAGAMSSHVSQCSSGSYAGSDDSETWKEKEERYK